MNKTFEPKEFENKLYQKWTKGGYFTPEIDKEKTPFTIVIPPPNITGQLHMGHALNNTLQDIVIRFKRMDGFATLWLPGTDHASIATELKIVEQLQAEGLSKAKVGRESFLERAFLWKEKYGGRIVEQLKRLGSSCDWTKEAFTMDEKCSKAVREVFVSLYEKGLIYRGYRMTNWCTSCGTAISDAEIEYDEKPSFLWHIKYPYTDGSGYMVVATTRPETILGDTAVAVNPDDQRYISVVGKTMLLPIINKEIPVIADHYVELGFGTGAVKITPAHDPNDFEVGERHNLEIVTVIDENGIMNENAAKYKGMTVLECRKAVVDDLKELGLIEKIEPHTHNVGECYRCKTAIEPRPCEQWFVKIESLAKPAIDVVRKGETKFIPQRFEKTYFNWMENIKDWCISRQLWWGHRIPCWYCDKCGEMIVSRTDPDYCPKCQNDKLRQDEDVLDTWFSSALWPFSTLGYPDKTKELEYFYPTSLLVTAYDIIFFWVARMIFSGIEHMGKTPFPEVLIHGIVRDEKGRKMSKSLGNGVDPLILIDKYGADSLRFSLTTGVAPGGDIRFSEDKMESSRNFMNKLWNASRYVIMNLEGKDVPPLDRDNLTNADKWILTKLQITIEEVRKNLEKYEFGLSLAKLYDFIWNDYCDWFIELTKPMLYSQDHSVKLRALSVLKFVLINILKLMHPFVPFITEEIWQNLNISPTIMLESYPKYDKTLVDLDAFDSFEAIKEIIVKIRNIRAEMNVPPTRKCRLFVKTANVDAIKNARVYIEKLVQVLEINFVSDKEQAGNKVCQAVTASAEIYIPLGELVDFEKEKARINKEIEKVTAEIKRSQSMLNNAGFVAKAPKKLVDSEREKLEKHTALLDKLNLQLKDFD
ncbi:MAG: valine--tRNA ligase [Clostridiales bacterium]|nr:valine--tRNA ligase [Clostridiales bacterium]